MACRTERLRPRLALALVGVCAVFSFPAGADDAASVTVPVVVSSAGIGGSFYTSELSLTNRGTTAANLRFTYTAAFGGGGGTATDTVAAGSQKTVPDAIEYLISIGVPIPASGNRGGVLRVDFTGLSSSDAGAATARTTSAVPGGRAGLAYPAVRSGLGGTAYLCGLRQDATDRSNVALLNMGGTGAGDVVLRLTAFSGDAAAPVSRVLPDLTLSPGGFRQYTEILKSVGLDRGYVRIDRVSGRAPYYAYATILDQQTSDGSYVPALPEDAVYAPGGLLLPVVVETSAFATEIVLANVSTEPKTVRLSYVADAIQTADSTAAVSISLGAGEQKVIPAFVPYLRGQGVPGVGAPGPTFAGALFLTVAGDDSGGVFLGGRTQTTGGGGRYGLFYTALARGTAASSVAWLYGLQQNSENRANLALVNTGEADAGTIGLHVDLYDGATGAVAGAFDVSLAPRRWKQLNAVLAGTGIANGYARISRTSGANPFLAYAVVVDGGTPQTRSDDGAFVIQEVQEPPASAELSAIRSVEAKGMSLLAQGVRRLDYARAIGIYMATLPAYAVTGVDEPSLTAYGVFPDGRLHLVTENREFDEIPPVASLRASRQGLATTELPGSGWARLLQSFGETRFTQEPVYDLAATLESPGGYGIRPGKAGDARLSALRTVSGDGFFYFNTHGGRAFKTKDRSGRGFFSLQSSTFVTPGNEALPEIAADLQAGRLTYFTAPNFNTVIDPRTGNQVDEEDTRYGITGDFVKTYWRFASDSIVFLNACWSGYTADPEGPQDFIDACWAAGAGVYFGWNEKANSGTCFTTVRYFVDRLIGANKFMKENPDQRAFPWELVYEDMRSEGLTHDRRTGADLVPFPRPGGNSILLDPSIKELIANEWEDQLILKGWFGSRLGRVWVGGRELSGCTWKHDEIRCVLPPTGPGSNGDAYVEVPSELGRYRKSNVRQLTEWAVELQYLWTDAYGSTGWRIDGSGILRYRGDVGGYRLQPGKTPELPIRAMWPTKDSALRLTASGTYSSGCTNTLSGTARFEAETNAPQQVYSLAQALAVDAHTPHVGAIGLAIGTLTGPPFLDTISGGPGCSTTIPIPATFGLLGGEVDFALPGASGGTQTLPLTGIPLTFDAQFRIPATRFIDIGMGGEMTIEWRAVDPVPPVKTDLAR
jgi:hypothetical protein